MQLRKLVRILKEIEKEYGGRIEVHVQAHDFKSSPWSFHKFNSVGVSYCFMEKQDGCLSDNETRIVSIGLEAPNIKEYK